MHHSMIWFRSTGFYNINVTKFVSKTQFKESLTYMIIKKLNDWFSCCKFENIVMSKLCVQLDLHR